MLVKNLIELVGNTPLMELAKVEEKYALKGKIFAKIEYFNPAGSVKDRIAMQMILDAEAEGKLKKGATIIEPTSGNTGIGLSAIGVARGYRVIIVMPESMSLERRKLVQAYGAELVLTEAALGMKGAIAKANELLNEIEGSVILGQFDNPSNPKVHYLTTGPEIYKDLNGKVDAFVSGVGTGGTISGVGKYLKEQNKDVKVIAVEPDASAVLSGEKPGPHMIQGIGAGFIPNTLNTKIYDEIIRVPNEQALEFGKMISRTEGILVGISSGAALFAGVQLAQRKEFEGKNIVVLLPDNGDRYLTTKLFEE
ncbi:MAG: cysteine synthase A [Bacilli bacterium]|nr:cysteine synthase A [Bacilli bacterium]